MSGRDTQTEVLIERLAQDLHPVRRLARPALRVAAWLGFVALAAVLLAARENLGAVAARLGAVPDMWLAVIGSVGTAVTASIAALMLALPDRDSRWALLPLPPAGLWLFANGMGCLREQPVDGLHPASLHHAMEWCMPFIMESSAVLAVPFAFLIWRARPLRLGLVAWTGGLAIASASSSLLWLDHPFDAGLLDFLVHAAAVGIVVLLFRTAALILPD